MEVVGVDGFRGGWVAVALIDGAFARAEVHASCAELLAHFPHARAIGIDIPIHPPDGPEPRAADLAARAFLGAAHSSVFPTPPRAALEAPTYVEAARICRELTGRGLSKQSYALAPRILEVDALARADARIIEVHPEVSFRALAGLPLGASKKTWTGQMLRRRLLRKAGIELPDDLGRAGHVPPDDALDAAAAAWSAQRYARGEGASLPDDGGARATIWH